MTNWMLDRDKRKEIIKENTNTKMLKLGLSIGANRQNKAAQGKYSSSYQHEKTRLREKWKMCFTEFIEKA